MTYKLFLDDIRDPGDSRFVIARSSDEAMEIIKEHGMPVFMQLDHDLGGDDTTIVFLKKLTLYMIEENLSFPFDFGYDVHSANPVGVENIKAYLDQMLKYLGETR